MKINSTVAVIVDVQVDEGWRCEGDSLVQGEPDADGQYGSQVLFDRDAIIEYVRDLLTGQETGDPPWRVVHAFPLLGSPPVALHSHASLPDRGHSLVIQPAQKVDADPRTFVRAVCSCGDYTSAVDGAHGATRAWVAHWQAKTKGIGR